MDQVAYVLKDFNIDPDCQIIIGSDIHTHLDTNLDNLGGRIECKPSVKEIKGMTIASALISSWTICNPVPWSQRNP